MTDQNEKVKEKNEHGKLNSEQIKAELTEEELKILDLSLPQMTGGAKKIVMHLAKERIKNEVLVDALEKIKFKINLASHETPFKKAKRLGEFEEIINKALADAGRPQ